jgi:hypothetical protein
MRAIVVLLMLAGCPTGPLPVGGDAGEASSCSAFDMAGAAASPCGASSPASSCSWRCFYSPARGYEWQSCSCSDCGPLDQVAEPCAWRCTFDPRAGGAFHWEQLYQGCSTDGGL